MMRMGRSTLRAFGLLIGPAMALVIALFAGGCGEQAAVSDASAPAGESAGANLPQPTQSSYDIEAMMKAMASTLQAEEPILRKALESMDSLDAADHQAYRDAMREQGKLARQIEAMLRENPTWIESTCGWFASVAKPAHDEVVSLRIRLMKTKDPESRANRYVMLQLGALGSTDAMREMLEWQAKSPGSPENLTVMCIKFGHIKGDGGSEAVRMPRDLGLLRSCRSGLA